ncbi:MAG: sugar O-acyltransferase [Puniceicoccaceae bacterium]|nr:sugar O-acyltransferase [Puniceicoccaceae bacterium]RCL31963.1 MAG: sugar O-acyltransferase [Puniceicoccaceae bacterium]
MKSVYIVGAGGLGREVYDWMHEALDFHNEYRFAGFLDDNRAALQGFALNASITPLKDYCYEEGDCLICGIGNPELKNKLCQPLVEAGAEFLTLIHPSAKVGARSEIGRGSVVCPQVVVTCDVRIGAFVLLNLTTTVGHDACIGDWSTLSAHCDVTGSVQLGPSVFMGSGARIIPKKTVGASATIGAGSVVIRDVSEGCSVFGNPARTIFSRSSKN